MNEKELQEWRKNLKLNPDQEWRRSTYLPFDQRKKILFLSDDLRLPSGVGTMTKEIIMNNLHHFSYACVAGAINHPEKGKVIDMSEEMGKITGVSPCYLRLYPYNGYGDPDLIRHLLNIEKAKAIVHFTDPRQWIWLYQNEAEFRQTVPILFYTIWDNLPYPFYNKNFYKSCDSLACISRQTYNICKQVLGKDNIFDMKKIETSNKTGLMYLPHGVNHNIFKRIDINNVGNQVTKKRKINKDKEEKYFISEFEDIIDFKKNIFKENDPDFIVFYNNRNIRRKMPGDVILAFKTFNDMLSPEERKSTALLMHTHVVDQNGTDLAAVVETIAPDCNIIFSTSKLDMHHLNYLYNIADITINMASAEGFGLSTAESLMAETSIIANVTGGLQDQMGFVDEKNELIQHEKHMNIDWGSNHDGKYKKHGKWVRPLFPKNRAMVGSPPTPYIFDDRCDWYDAALALKYWYDKTIDERADAGKEGRKFLIDNGFTAQQMGLNFINYINSTLHNFKPRKRFELYKIKSKEKIKNNIGVAISDFQKNKG